ncbi:MAG: hypothetical protein COU27_03445 [Candidatus Levybacteria bacterium CG10_big_fil_rev_8_21_14_0_10_36_7]|nr:MAG: hypothetical protein COU27_03445 [Candidatus Levybacteria bacterium CG10_big_fil_rev_8_21_14_0_10_36_7]
MSSQLFTSKFIKKEKKGKNTYSFHFKKPNKFEFVAGQYLKMKLDINNSDSRGNSRYFTVSSSPTEKDLVITTRIIKSSFKKKLMTLKTGDEAIISGPWGDIVFPKKRRPIIFLTGGIGITPFRSLCIFARDKNLDFKITLLVSFSTAEDSIFDKEFKKIESDNFKYIKTITHPDKNWKGEKGRIDAQKIRKYVKNVDKSIFYVTGPLGLVEGILKLLKDNGIKKGHIISEDFPGY